MHITLCLMKVFKIYKQESDIEIMFRQAGRQVLIMTVCQQKILRLTLCHSPYMIVITQHKYHGQGQEIHFQEVQYSHTRWHCFNITSYGASPKNAWIEILKRNTMLKNYRAFRAKYIFWTKSNIATTQLNSTQSWVGLIFLRNHTTTTKPKTENRNCRHFFSAHSQPN